VVGEQLFVFGGGAFCFSFGTLFGSCYSLDLPSLERRLPRPGKEAAGKVGAGAVGREEAAGKAARAVPPLEQLGGGAPSLEAVSVLREGGGKVAGERGPVKSVWAGGGGSVKGWVALVPVCCAKVRRGAVGGPCARRTTRVADISVYLRPYTSI
jgi:hypothetical protein